MGNDPIQKAWNDLLPKLPTDTWPQGAEHTYFGFFCHGWHQRSVAVFTETTKLPILQDSPLGEHCYGNDNPPPSRATPANPDAREVEKNDITVERYAYALRRVYELVHSDVVSNAQKFVSEGAGGTDPRRNAHDSLFNLVVDVQMIFHALDQKWLKVDAQPCDYEKLEKKLADAQADLAEARQRLEGLRKIDTAKLRHVAGDWWVRTNFGGKSEGQLPGDITSNAKAAADAIDAALAKKDEARQ